MGSSAGGAQVSALGMAVDVPAEYHDVRAEVDGTARLQAEISRRNNVRIWITTSADPARVGG